MIGKYLEYGIAENLNLKKKIKKINEFF